VLANGILFTLDDFERGFELYLRPPRRIAARLVGDRLARWMVPAAYASTFTPYPDARSVNRGLLELLEAPRGAPRLVVANYMEPHHPYVPSGRFRGLFAPVVADDGTGPARRAEPHELRRRLEARYDEELVSLDAAVGELLRELEEGDLLDRSWLIVTSDHGESFGANDVTYHGSSIYNSQVRIPLIIKPPRGIGLPRGDSPVGLADVAATIAAITTDAPLGGGRDLRRAPERSPQVPIEHFGDPRPGNRRYGERMRIPGRAVVAWPWKLIEHGERPELYKLDDDPAEAHDLAGSMPERVDALRGLLPPGRAAWRSRDSRQRPVTAEERERLRALGYVY
jgi:arylsulfatase A-like enzyme